MTADAAPEDRQKLGTLLRAVVKVFTVSDPPDYEQPWQTQGSVPSVGSGVVIDTKLGMRVLTNAHCVEDHVFVEVRRYGRAQKVAARAEAIAYDCDLALLAIDDESFFRGVTPIEVGPLAALSDVVSVCGYPVGGERLSITRGIVSRIDLVRYEQTQRQLLALQIDAAINTGNSGGPVMRGDELIGIAFQALEDAEKVGYVIATPVIRHFLTDVEQGRPPEFPSLGALVQPLESRAHRASLGLDSDQERGVLIRRVAFGGSAWGVLEEGDVLLEIDGAAIMPDGTVELRDGELVDFAWLVAERHVGQAVNARAFRRGAEIQCVIPLKPPAYLVTEDRYDVPPTYFVFGGMLFVPLTKNYLKTYSDPWWQHAPRELLVLYEQGVPAPSVRERVVLQKVLADRVNQGYHGLESVLLRTVDGREIGDMRHFVELIEGSSSRYVELESDDGRRIVIERETAIESGPDILERFGVPSDRSEDLME